MLGFGPEVTYGPASATGPGILTTSAQSWTGNKSNLGKFGIGTTADASRQLTVLGTASSTIPVTRVTDGTCTFDVFCATSSANVQMGTSSAHDVLLLRGGTVVGRFLSAGIAIGSAGTSLTLVKVYSQTITPASVAANTTAEQTFTVTGLTTADKVTFNPGAAPTAGTGIVGWRVSAADTLAVTYSNNTAGALTPVSSTCLILATRS